METFTALREATSNWKFRYRAKFFVPFFNRLLTINTVPVEHKLYIFSLHFIDFQFVPVSRTVLIRLTLFG